MDKNTIEKPNTPTAPNKWQMVSLAGELGFIIALPLVAFGFVGKWLDGKLGTEPWMALVGIAIAITATTVWITQRFKTFIK